MHRHILPSPARSHSAHVTGPSDRIPKCLRLARCYVVYEATERRRSFMTAARAVSSSSLAAAHTIWRRCAPATAGASPQ